jgi:hypothetical protein
MERNVKIVNGGFGKQQKVEEVEVVQIQMDAIKNKYKKKCKKLCTLC